MAATTARMDASNPAEPVRQAEPVVDAPAEYAPRLRYLWETWHRGGTWVRPEGQVLAALRRGLGRPSGSTPAMWPYYRHLTEDGRTSRWLDAEHIALTLLGVHQQSKSTPMHADGVGLGTAVLALSRIDTVSEQAVERRFAAAATATSLSEVAAHLRGLVTQLRGAGIALDYTRLVRDLADWTDPARQDQVRRRWGSQYYAPPRPNAEPTTPHAPSMPTEPGGIATTTDTSTDR